MTVEEAIKNGYHSKTVMRIAKKELGENATRRKLLQRIREAEQKVKQ